MKNLITRLSNIGLTKNEAKVYYFLLKNPPITGSELSKKMKMDRTLVYQILNQLIDKKTVSYYTDDNNKRLYITTSTKNLYLPIKEKEMDLDSLLPELEKIKNKEQLPSQEVSIFQGVIGIKKYLDELIKEKEILIIGGLVKSSEIHHKLFEKIVLEHKNKIESIKGKVILSETVKDFKKCISDKKNIFGFNNFKFKVFDHLSNLNTTVIFKDRIATHIMTDRPIIIFIKSKKLAKDYREYFEKIWNISSNLTM